MAEPETDGKPSDIGARIRGALWLDDSRDHLAHAWRYVVAGGQWRALCGLIADPQTLTEPEDEFGHHLECDLMLGDELADRSRPGDEWRD